ncbi:hypothetical protein SH528x_003068 [Novipirellula sp. SH528]|uniref:hypothetical protein n=1 Tax=Novipirellula sp. SH528 TaxID=3454466 RepID=UPI003F9FF5ED
MSSSRGGKECEAVIHNLNAKKGHREISGSVVLPEVASEEFVAEFNRVYASIGWTIERLKGKQAETQDDAAESAS